MTKVEILKRQKEKDQIEAQEKYDSFISFMESEGFIETIDKVGNFAEGKPMFYRKVSEELYLVFNLPTFNNIKKYGFHADFWKVSAKSQSELLSKIIDDKNRALLMASFNLNRDLDLYKMNV